MEPISSSFQSKKQKYQSLMNQLSKSSLLSLPTSKSSSQQIIKPINYYENKEDSFNELILPGMIFELIVVKKDQTVNELGVILWRHRGEINGSKYQGKKIGEIGCYNLKGIIKDFEINEDFSIFGYCKSFKRILVGQVLLGHLLRVIKRDDNIIFEFSLRNNLASTELQLGILNQGQDKASIQFYEQKGVFPIQYQLKLNQGWKNPRYFANLVRKYKINQWETLSSHSNKPIFFEMGLHYQRIRTIQNQQWAMEYFREGLALTKQMKHQQAIQQFNQALKIDSNNPDIYVAKGCALANIKNYQQGIKQLNIALQLDCNHKQAKAYLQKLKQHTSIHKVVNKQDPFNNLIAKSTTQSTGQYKLIHKK